MSSRAPQRIQSSKVPSSDCWAKWSHVPWTAHSLPRHVCDIGGLRLRLVCVWPNGIPESPLDFWQWHQWFDHLQRGHSGHPLTVQNGEWRCCVTQKTQQRVWRRRKESRGSGPWTWGSPFYWRDAQGSWEPCEFWETPWGSRGRSSAHPWASSPGCLRGCEIGQRALARILEIWVPVSLLDLSKSLSCRGHLWNEELVCVWGGGGRVTI